MDEAASKLRIEIDSLPTEIDVVERRVRQLEIERVALAKETDARQPGSARGARRASWPTSPSSATPCSPSWTNEKEAIGRIQALKEELEQLRSDLEREADLEKAAEIRYGRIPELERQVEEASDALDRPPGRHAHAQGGGRRGGRRRDRGQVDRRARVPAHGGRDGQARPHGGGAPRAGDRPGRGGGRGGQRHPPRRGPACPIRTGRSARSSSSAPPASARPSWPAPSPTSCSTTSGRWSASTCPSTWRSTR